MPATPVTRPPRSGAYMVSRAVKSRAAGVLSLAEYGLLSRIWDDLRWTAKRIQTKTGWFDLQAGQAVISVGAYAAEFRCHHRVITRGLDALEKAGWFRVESSRRGTIVTCLVDPRDCQPKPQEPQDAIEEVRPTVAEGVRPLVADPVRPTVAEGVRPLVADPLTTLSRGIHQAVSTPLGNAPGCKTPGVPESCSLGGGLDQKTRAVAVAGAVQPPSTPTPVPVAVPKAQSPKPKADPVPSPSSPPPTLAEAVSLVGVVVLAPSTLLEGEHAGLERGDIAAAVVEGRSEAEVLAWLTVLAERRRRVAKGLCRPVRKPLALFRWLCKHGRFPARAYEDAKRRLSGHRQDDAATRRHGDAETGPPAGPQRIGEILENSLARSTP